MRTPSARGLRRCGVALTAAAALLPATPGATAARTGPADWLPAGARPSVVRGLATVGRVRAAVATHRLVPLLAAALEASGRDFPVAVSPLPSLPAAVARAVAFLDAPSGAHPARALARDLAGWGVALRTGPRETRPLPDGFAAPARSFGVPITAAPHLGLDPSLHAAAARAPAAALVIATALDRALPALLASAPAPTQARVDGCDVLDQLPTLCVGSSADNTYTGDAQLLVDLGGNDTYTNSAGGAEAGVSVNVDLGGNDRYLPTGHIANGGAVTGVGILVDVAGDDVYEHASPSKPLELFVGQGAGGLGGVGILLDLGGSDRYSVTAASTPAPVSTPDESVTLTAQGAGVSLAGAVGVLVDVGRSDDAYTLDAGRVEQAHGGLGFPTRAAIGQGAGVGLGGGIGVLADDGGRDTFVASASGRRVGGGYDAVCCELFGGGALVAAPTALVQAQGLGLQGSTGLLLEGLGATTYRAEAVSEGVAYSDIAAQGSAVGFTVTAGNQNLLGVLDDAGGDDTYTARASVTYDFELVVDDPCTTEEEGETVPCRRASAEVSAFSPTVSSRVRAQGAVNWPGGTGILQDHRGDDRYEATSDQRLDVTLHDRLDAPEAPPLLSVLGYDASVIQAQGYAYGSLGPGPVAMLADLLGNDSYLLRSRNETLARADSDRAEGDPEVVSFSNYNDYIGGQGAAGNGSATAALLDLRGVGDRFLAEASNPATATPPEGEFRLGYLWSPFQGGSHNGLAGVQGNGIFAALGNDPVIVSAPSRPVCRGTPGYRGFGAWSEYDDVCAVVIPEDPEHQRHDDYGHAGGTAPNTVGAAPTIQITTDTPGQAQAEVTDTVHVGIPRLPVGARLTDPSGSPLAGRTVHFTIETSWTSPVLGPVGLWYNTYQADAITDADGVARASLPLGFTVDPAAYQFRLAADYDGEAGLYPRLTTKPLQLTAAA